MKRLLNAELAPRLIVAFAAVFFLLVAAGNRLHLLVCQSGLQTDCVPFWPVSVAMLRRPPNINYPNPAHLGVAFLSILLTLAALRALEKTRYPTWLVAAFGLALILATTLTHGIQLGLERPIAGMGLTKAEYYNDSERVSNPLDFLRDFETIQPTLNGHSGTHPPGAVLLFYFLRTGIGDPRIIALAIAGLSVGLTALVFRATLTDPADRVAHGRALLLLFLLPAVQIYYAASLDAIIAPLMLGSVLWLTSVTRARLAAATICLILVSTLTFNFLFALPVLAAMVWMKRAGLPRLLIQLGALGLFWISVYALLGFNYLHSFTIATSLENPAGFRLIATPGDYLMTRVEDVAEILLFLGPAALLVVLRGFRQGPKKDDLATLSAAAVASLLLVFLSGAYRTGETARAAMFIYPFLMLPTAVGFRQAEVAARFGLVAGLTFAQSLLMQLVGNYFW